MGEKGGVLTQRAVSIFVCLSMRACVRVCVHVEVNTSNLTLKECSVFRSRPSRCRRPTTTDVHLGDSAAKVQGGETRRSAAAQGHAGGEINGCSRHLRNLGFTMSLREAQDLSCCMFSTDGTYCAAVFSPKIIWRFLIGSHV